MDNKTGSNHGRKVVRKCKNSRETVGKLSNRGLRFWHDMAIHGPKKGPKTAIFPNALFLHFTWDLPTIFAGGPIPNAKKGTFLPEVLIQRSYSCVGKGPNQRNTLYFSNEKQKLHRGIMMQ